MRSPPPSMLLFSPDLISAKPLLRAATSASISVLRRLVAITAAQVLIIKQPSSKRWSSRTTRRAFSSGVV